MWNNTNPAELFSGTTWELLTAGKYIQSGSTALQIGGSNSISISKANLPAISLKVNSFSVTTQAHKHTLKSQGVGTGWKQEANALAGVESNSYASNTGTTFSGGGQNTGTASPSTETLGSGTALSIQPSYITLKFWKRLT